ncbi:MAG: metallothionein [Planctomycetia bacterium]
MADAQKCNCPNCTCKVTEATGVIKAGKLYCSGECADNHPHQDGCGHAGCPCGSK